MTNIILPRKNTSIDSPVSAIGLGCSRLGSILGLSAFEAEQLVRGACDLGVNFFDTADIYGQGDSERILGRVLPKQGAIVATKVGQRFPPYLRAINLLKRPLAPLLRSSKAASKELRDRRQSPLPRDFTSTYLNAAVERSLRRLRRETIDILFLHSPDLQTVTDGEAVGTLDKLRLAGKIGKIGISADTDEVVLAALRDPRVAAVQCKLGADRALKEALGSASGRGVHVVAREILGGARRAGRPLTVTAVQSAVQSAFSLPFVTTALVGTTKITHLKQIANILAGNTERTNVD